MSTRKRCAGGGMSLACAALLTVSQVAVAGEARTVVTFDPAAGEFPEGVAAARIGDVYAGLSALGRVVRVAADGQADDFTHLVLGEGDFGLTGLAIDGGGTLYAAVNSADPALHGVVGFGSADGEPFHLPGSEAITMPNAIAFGDDGAMYISDSVGGSIWRAEWVGFEGWQPAEAWVTDPLLAGTGELPFPFPVGANGVAVDDGVVYVGVTEQSHIVGIPIGPEGEAGEPFVHLSPPGVAIDGIAITDDGDFIVADPPANTIWRIGGDGVPVALADAEDGISGPTSVYVETASGEPTVYVANMAQAVIGELAPHPPSIVAVTLD